MLEWKTSSMWHRRRRDQCRWQSQIQDFPKEWARFRVKCHVDAIQWGGGVVAKKNPWSPKPYAIQWGGGSSRILS